MIPRTLLVAPPLSQLNTPYPAITYLTAWLRSQGYPCRQADLSIETLRALLSRGGLRALFDDVARHGEVHGLPPEAWEMLGRRRRYEEGVDVVVGFLSGRDPTAAHRLAFGDVVPPGPRAAAADGDEAFGPLGIADRAKHRATLFVDDLSDLVKATVAPHFGLTRYADRLAAAAPSYDPIAEALAHPPNLVDRLFLQALDRHVEAFDPHLVAFSVPFPGNLYAALRGGRYLKATRPGVRIALGGGYVNTELRELAEPRLFDAVDYVCLDDGERPLLTVVEHLAGAREVRDLKRTFTLQGSKVEFCDGDQGHDVPLAATPAPTWDGLDPGLYLSVLGVLNPTHRLWSDGRWLKLTLAHGCYWRRCAFCDVGLPYIGHYDPAPARALVDKMEAMAAETGGWGFHFVDEAAPPALLKELSLELLRRGHRASWWGNLRFEARFDADLARLMAAAGCIAVSGGLEVASDRLLALMEKGVTVAQVARVCDAFTAAGIMVHAYLMYGFPTQTAAETVDSLERVRQLFAAGILHSAYWHRFVATVHSPVGRDPARFGVTVEPVAEGAFARNDLTLLDPTGVDHDALGGGLDAALFNYMNGAGLDRPAHRWFEGGAPRADVPPGLIEDALGEAPPGDAARAGQRAVWLGSPPLLDDGLHLSGPGGEGALDVPEALGAWLAARLVDASPREAESWPPPPLASWREGWDALGEGPFEDLLESDAWATLRELGLILV